MMKIHPTDIGQIYATYVDNEISPKAQSALQKFWAYGSVYVVQKKAEEYLGNPERVKQLQTMGIMTQDGHIDIDYLREMTTMAMEKSGGHIEAMGLILDQSDIERVYNISRSFAK